MRPVIEELRPLRPSPSTARHRAHGCALVPAVALDGHDERMCVLDVDGLLAPRRIGLAWSVCGPLGAARAA